MKTPRLLPFAVAACALLDLRAGAEVKLPAIVSDNMVLQQEVPANVWGWAEPGERVTVKFAGKSASATAGADGKWKTKLEGLDAGKTGDLTISGGNTITIHNVAVGEVWVCSGQSNMEMTVNRTLKPEEEAGAANYPMLRMFTVTKKPAAEPQSDCVGKWEVCTPETVPLFSAAGYFFARQLHATLKQPIGMIHTSWGGTPAEFWTPKPILARDADFKGALTGWEQKVANYPKAKEAYDQAMVKWKEEAQQAKDAGKPAPPQPRAPQGGDAFGSPGCLFNGMISPIVNYTIRGAIWYQGEANAGNAKGYYKLFPTMIMSWRALWGAEFPFLFVQLANFNARHIPPTGQPEDSQWAELRESQLNTLELPHTGMAVAIDIGEGEDIHPKNKQEVGRRLALAAEATVYFQEHEFSGPIFSGAQIEDGKMRLNFRNAEGMNAGDGGKLKGFAIAGEDRKFVWADTEIDGDHIVVSSPDVPHPVAVRYGWADNPTVNLVNATGLPASPFRTDDWPQVMTAK